MRRDSSDTGQGNSGSSEDKSVSSGISLKGPPPQTQHSSNSTTLGIWKCPKPRLLLGKVGVTHPGDRVVVKDEWVNTFKCLATAWYKTRNDHLTTNHSVFPIVWRESAWQQSLAVLPKKQFVFLWKYTVSVSNLRHHQSPKLPLAHTQLHEVGCMHYYINSNQQYTARGLPRLAECST